MIFYSPELDEVIDLDMIEIRMHAVFPSEIDWIFVGYL